MHYLSRITLTSEPVGWLGRLPAVRALAAMPYLALTAPVTFLVGENGSGKSTLLEGIAVAYGFNPEGGSRNFSFSTRDTHAPLHEHLRLSRPGFPRDSFFLRAESFYNAASYVDALDTDGTLRAQYGGLSLHEQSHGESFLALIQNRFRGHGLYLLDEPEAALSPTRQLTLLGRIHELVKERSQLLIATHSPILLSYPGAQILQLSARGIEEAVYEETEHYRVTRSFLENPERMLGMILE